MKTISIERNFKANVPKLVEYYFDIIFCEYKLTDNMQKSERDRIVKAYENHLHKFPIYAPRLRINTPRDIVTQLRRGRIDLAMAKEFMAVLKDEWEITELPKLMEKLEEITSE